MSRSTPREIRLALALAPILLGFAATSPVASAGTFYVTGIYNQDCELYRLVSCGGNDTLIGIPQAPSFFLDQTFQGTNISSIPGDAVTTTADSHLFISANSAILHAEADTSITFAMNPPLHALDPLVVFAEARVDNLDAFDNIRFISGSVASGTTITYTVTEVLDSTITGSCDPLGSAPNGASFGIVTMNSLPVLGHTFCGQGSDHMSATGTFSSTVGATIGLETEFQMESGAGYGNNVPAISSFSLSRRVDASNTAAVYINVLTPGVTFVSDSGLTYQPDGVPEPGSLALLGGGCLILAAGVMRRQRGRCYPISKRALRNTPAPRALR